MTTPGSVTTAVQAAMAQAMRSDPVLTSIIGDRVFDDVPTDAPHPCVSFGPEDWQQVQGDCLATIQGTVQVDVWSRAPGRSEAKEIADHVATLFHDVELVLQPPWRGVACDVVMRRVFDDPDGITKHAVVMVAVIAE